MKDQRTELAGVEYQPEGQIRDYFFGAWKLVATEKKYPGGHTMAFPEFGADALGFLFYSPSGHMCAQLMKAERGRPVDKAPASSQAAAALDGFISYCGSFEIREDERAVIHRPETASSRDWVGTVQTRPYHIVSRDRFFFHGTEQEKQSDGSEVPVVWTITWERLK